MAFNLKNMTVDFRSLLKLTVTDRVNMSRTPEGLSWLAALTPSQLAELFPSYYRQKLPDLGKVALSGGVPLSGPTTSAGSGFPAGRARPPASVSAAPPTGGAKAPTNAKPSWVEKLEKNAPPEVTAQAPGRATQAQAEKPAGRTGPIDRSKFAEELKDPGVRKMFAAMMQSEVGSQGRQSQVAFAETVFNRAMYEGKTLKSILEKKPSIKANYYEPHRTGKYDQVLAKMKDTDFLRNGSIIDHVAGGSNTVKGAAHNASAGVARSVRQGGYDAVTSTIVEVGGETYYMKKWEVPKYAKLPRFEEATAVQVQDPNQTGDASMKPLIPGGPTPGPAVAPITNNTIVPPLPNGLSDEILKYYNSLPDDAAKDRFRKQVHHSLSTSKETIESLNKSATENQQTGGKQTASPFAEPPKVATGTDGQKLYDVNAYGRGPNLSRTQLEKQGIDPLLIDSIYEGTKVAFGDPKDPKTRYVVQVSNAARNDPSSKHGHGKAADVQIFDRETGKYVGGTNDIMKNALGNAHTYRHFEVWNQGMYKYVHDKYGKDTADRLSSGLYFKARQNNSFDNMHISLDERGRNQSGGMQSQGSIRGGASKEFQEILQRSGAQPSQAMGDVSKWVSPYAPARDAIVDKASSVPPVPPKAENPTGKSAETSLIPGGPTPGPAEPAPPPVKARGIIDHAGIPKPTATPEPEKKEKEVPAFQYGGEAQASGDNAYVVGETGKPLFTMNTERERMSYDPSANSLKVEPTHRTNTDALQSRTVERQDATEQESDAYPDTVQRQPAQAAPGSSGQNHNWSGMMNSMVQSSANIYETASFHRAVAKSRFIEVGDSVKGGHYSYGASNLKWI